jgi:hypothetical protein
MSRNSNKSQQQVEQTSSRNSIKSQPQVEQTSSRSSIKSQPQVEPSVSRISQKNESRASSKQEDNISVRSQKSHQSEVLILNGSQASIRSNASVQSAKSNKSEAISYIQDAPRGYSSAADRDLINKSRNGYIGTEYISDVKQYFEHPSFDGIVTETNKKYLEDLLSDFRKLLNATNENPEDSIHDVEFFDNEDDNSALPGHKQLLTARSATFEALFKKFDNGEKEYLGFRLISDSADRVKRILLPSEDPNVTRELMEASLHYMYWGNIDENLIKQEASLRQFYEVASFLDLKELRRNLAQELYTNLRNKGSPSLAIAYLKLAVKCGCKYLKKETIDYIVRYKSIILKDKAWGAFSTDPENKELVKEIYQRMVEKSNE